MSKKKRPAFNGSPTNIKQINQEINKMLRVDFGCTEEEIELLDHATRGMAPEETASHISDIMERKVPLKIRPKMVIDMGDGETEELRLTNHPLILFHDFCVEQYGLPFGSLYWNAFTANKPNDFLVQLKNLKRVPYFQDSRKELLARSTQNAPASDDGNEVQ